MKFCSGCKFLSQEEWQQSASGRLKPHSCNKYNKRVWHHLYHPQLPRLAECMTGNGYKPTDKVVDKT